MSDYSNENISSTHATNMNEGKPEGKTVVNSGQTNGILYCAANNMVEQFLMHAKQMDEQLLTEAKQLEEELITQAKQMEKRLQAQTKQLEDRLLKQAEYMENVLCIEANRIEKLMQKDAKRVKEIIQNAEKAGPKDEKTVGNVKKRFCVGIQVAENLQNQGKAKREAFGSVKINQTEGDFPTVKSSKNINKPSDDAQTAIRGSLTYTFDFRDNSFWDIFNIVAKSKNVKLMEEMRKLKLDGSIVHPSMSLCINFKEKLQNTVCLSTMDSNVAKSEKCKNICFLNKPEENAAEQVMTAISELEAKLYGLERKAKMEKDFGGAAACIIPVRPSCKLIEDKKDTKNYGNEVELKHKEKLDISEETQDWLKRLFFEKGHCIPNYQTKSSGKTKTNLFDESGGDLPISDSDSDSDEEDKRPRDLETGIERQERGRLSSARESGGGLPNSESNKNYKTFKDVESEIERLRQERDYLSSEIEPVTSPTNVQKRQSRND